MRRHLATLLAIAATGCTIQVTPLGPVGPRVTGGSPLPGEEPSPSPSLTVAVTPRPQPTRSPVIAPSARPSAVPSPGRSAVPSARPTGRPSPGQLVPGQGPDPFQMPASARVPLNYASYLATDSQGAVYIVEEYGRRVWRRTPDGELRQVLGEAPNAPPGWKLEGPVAAAVDAQDRLLVLDATRALRVEADGRVSVLLTGLGGRAGYIAAGEGDEVWVVDTYTWDSHYTLHHVGGQGASAVRVQLPGGLLLWGFGRDRQGRLIGELHAGGPSGDAQRPSNQGAVVLDPVTGQPSPLTEIPDGGECTVDSRGNVYFADADGAWKVLIDGRARPLHAAPPHGLVAYDEQTETLFTSAYYQVFASRPGTGQAAIAGTGERPKDQ